MMLYGALRILEFLPEFILNTLPSESRDLIAVRRRDSPVVPVFRFNL